MYPELPFFDRPFLRRKIIALTFGDGPDGAAGVTNGILDILAAHEVKATFFCIQYNNDLPVADDPIAKAQFRRIVAEGHDLWNHTLSHPHMATLTPSEIREQWQKLEDLVHRDDILGPFHPPLTLLRLPYGEPLEGLTSDKDWVGPIGAEFGVHIGWNIDPRDWEASAEEVLERVLKAVDEEGKDGTVLLHAVKPSTLVALPKLIEGLKERRFEFLTMEELLKERYGMTSGEMHRSFIEQ